jgi:hypothetical protein
VLYDQLVLSRYFASFASAYFGLWRLAHIRLLLRFSYISSEEASPIGVSSVLCLQTIF